VSKKEFDNIFEEVIEYKKDYVDQLVKIVYDKKFNYMFINTDSQRLFKNFDEIIID
jgi:hypothetical protein